MVLRQFVTYIFFFFAHERTLLAAKQQSSCVYVYIHLYICTYTYIRRHTEYLFKDKSPHQTGFQLRVILLIRAAVTVPLQLPPPYPSSSFFCCSYCYF